MSEVAGLTLTSAFDAVGREVHSLAVVVIVQRILAIAVVVIIFRIGHVDAQWG